MAKLKIRVICLQDDANHDPQWSFEQCLAYEKSFGGVLIGRSELEIMEKMTVTIFEILERAWAALDCSLIDMKIEFGVVDGTGKNVFSAAWLHSGADWVWLHDHTMGLNVPRGASAGRQLASLTGCNFE